MGDESQSRPPRGALVVIAVGLLATLAAALLSTDKPLGAVALEWVEEAKMPGPKSAAIPGGGAMTLSEGQIRSTGANAGEYTLFRSSALLTIDAGSAIGHGRLRCTIAVPKRTIVAKTPKSRASYPRSSEDLADQEVHDTSLLEYSSHSAELASVEIGDVISSRYTREPGIVVEWAPYRIGRQTWQLGFPSGRPEEPLRLPFVSIWRTTIAPAARVTCTMETAAGAAIVATSGRLDA
jgi:hypothetical protein